MPRYRYRTAALTGPWRDSSVEAARDAVRAKQAEADGDDPASLRWVVPGAIEVMQASGTRSRASH